MNYLNNHAVDFRDITPAMLEKYLQRLGFELRGEARNGRTWIGKAADMPAVLVPHAADRQLSGYWETIDSALERLSIVTGKDKQAVVDIIIAS